ASAVSRDNYVAEANLGAALLEQGRRAEALVHLRRSAAIKPGYAKVHVSLGKALAEGGDPEAALREYTDAIRLDGDSATAHYNLAGGLAGAGRMDEAIAELRQALRLRPDWPEGRAALAEVEGRRREAVRRGP